MNAMNRIAILALFPLLVATPLAQAKEKVPKECVLDAKEWGGHLVPDTGHAEAIIDSGMKPLQDPFEVLSDAGWFGNTFVVFDLPEFRDPVLLGKLRMQIEFVSTGGQTGLTELAVALHDVIDVPLLLQPVWTFEEFESITTDLASGRLYGNFIVRNSSNG